MARQPLYFLSRCRPALQPNRTCISSDSRHHEENRSDLVRRFLPFPRARPSGRAVKRSQRGLSEGLHDVAAGRETRARQSISGCAREIPVCRQPARRIAQDPRQLATGDRRVPRPQDWRKYPARAEQDRHAKGPGGDLGAASGFLQRSRFTREIRARRTERRSDRSPE